MKYKKVEKRLKYVENNNNYANQTKIESVTKKIRSISRKNGCFFAFYGIIIECVGMIHKTQKYRKWGNENGFQYV